MNLNHRPLCPNCDSKLKTIGPGVYFCLTCRKTFTREEV